MCLAGDTLDLASVPAHAETWEKVIRRLRSRLIPPAGAPRPDATVDGFTSWLEVEGTHHPPAVVSPFTLRDPTAHVFCAARALRRRALGNQRSSMKIDRKFGVLVPTARNLNGWPGDRDASSA